MRYRDEHAPAPPTVTYYPQEEPDMPPVEPQTRPFTQPDVPIRTSCSGPAIVRLANRLEMSPSNADNVLARLEAELDRGRDGDDERYIEQLTDLIRHAMRFVPSTEGPLREAMQRAIDEDDGQ